MSNRAKFGTLRWLGLAVLAGCSSEGGRPRDMLPAAGGSGGSGGSTNAMGGTSPAASGAGGGVADVPNRGDVLEFVPGTGMVPYAIGENDYGIRGGAFLARSALGNSIEVGSDPTKICISGNLEEVPNGNYGQYWGVEIGFNLNQGPAPGATGGAPGLTAPDPGLDAGIDAALASDAAPEPEVAQPWSVGNVIGFSFVIEGPTINLIRFKALPAGYDRTLESSVFCKGITPPSGEAQDVLFTEIAQYCWNATANVLVPTANGLDNISWQLPADVAVGPRPFDWCLRDLRPILAE